MLTTKAGLPDNRPRRLPRREPLSMRFAMFFLGFSQIQGLEGRHEILFASGDGLASRRFVRRLGRC